MAHFADAVYSTPEIAAIFDGAAFVQRLLDVEAALAGAQARAGLVPQSAADDIGRACRIEQIDVDAVFAETAASASPVVPLVRQIHAQLDDESAPFLHWGATTQDLVDTAAILQARDARDVLVGRLAELGAETARLTERHRHDPMAARTLMQQALPITFGLKTAHWLDAITRRIDRLQRLDADVFALQFGGAAGTQAALGAAGADVTQHLAAELTLIEPDLPWHTQRDRIAELASGVAIVAGTVDKIAADIILLAQTEVGEVAEGGDEAKGSSSTLPHKRNPVDAVLARAAARVATTSATALLNAPAPEHERAAAAWQAEWAILPRTFEAADAALTHLVDSIGGLRVHTDRMRANLDASNGLLMAEAISGALASHLGRQQAKQLVAQACRRAADAQRHLRDILGEDPVVTESLDQEALDHLFDPTAYLGSSDLFIDRALERFRQRVATASEGAS